MLYSFIVCFFYSFIGDSDYQPIFLEVTFSGENGLSRQCAPIQIIDDPIPEEDEFFLVGASTTDEAVIVDPATTQIFIIDDGM